VLDLPHRGAVPVHTEDAGAVMRAVLVFGALLAALACRAEISVQDDSGHRVTLAAPAQRVVSLAPHLTEMAFAVGGGAAVKAVIRYSDHPAAARRLPIVGDAFALDFEAIARLKPDLVLVWTSGLNERHRARLRSLGLTLYESEIRHAAAIAQTLRRLGTLLGHDVEAAAAGAEFERRWQSLRERHARKAPLRVFWQLWQDPLMTVNREHLIGEAIEACAGVNVFGALPLLTPTVSWEAAIEADPQLIAASGRPGDAARDFARWQRFAQVNAVRRKQFVSIDGDLIGRMGPRFVLGAAELCEAIERARPN
jgi:iron complex transport system substrate-binding protein